jgi:hypothetical protein
MKLNYALDEINHLFQMVAKNRDDPYGNKVLLLGGDFRQCLPVVRHGNRVKIIESTIKTNETWPLFRQLRFVQNMRTAAGSQDYADWLIQLGNGTLPSIPTLNDPELIEIPQDFLELPTNLIDHVFGHPSQLLNPEVAETISSRAILCPKNIDCLRINNMIVSKMPGAVKLYKSIDNVDSKDPEEIADYPAEVLNTFDVFGLPPHALHLKVGAVVTLLKNIDTLQGLCNRTRLILKNLTDNLIVAEIDSEKKTKENPYSSRGCPCHSSTLTCHSNSKYCSSLYFWPLQ